MPAKELVPEYRWSVRLRDGGSQVLIQAAYIQEGFGATTTLGSPQGAGLIVLKDGSHKTVFAVPSDQLAHIQRMEPVSRPSGKNAILPVPGGLPRVTPGQLRDLQDSVNGAIAEGAVRVTFMPPGASVLPSG